MYRFRDIEEDYSQRSKLKEPTDVVCEASIFLPAASDPRQGQE